MTEPPPAEVQPVCEWGFAPAAELGLSFESRALSGFITGGDSTTSPRIVTGVEFVLAARRFP